ncbi:hypothetical protein JL721_9417 [Aureococcus anophagefferens]|nr:hypothetical protein JL721_9417 [Aureococcus anophagefferens]
MGPPPLARSNTRSILRSAREESESNVFDDVKRKARSATRKYRSKKGLQSPYLSTSASASALAYLRHADALRHPEHALARRARLPDGGGPRPLDLGGLSSPLNRAVSRNSALASAQTLARLEPLVPPAEVVERSFAKVLERSASGRGLERYDAVRVDVGVGAPRESAAVADAPRSPNRTPSKTPKLNASPKKGDRPLKSRKGSARSPKRPSTATVPEDAALPDGADLDAASRKATGGVEDWPFERAAGAFFMREDVDPEDRGRSVLSRAGSITRAERSEQREGKLPSPRDVAYYDGRVMTIGPRCRSVHGWRRGPPELYYQNCKALDLVPEPGITAMLAALAGADRPAVDVSKRSVGDGLASALAGPAAKADRSSCRSRLPARCRRRRGDLRRARGGAARGSSLDLSDNRLRSRAATDALARLVAAEASTPAGTLLTLRLANCALSSRAGAALMAAWKDRDGALRLSELDLSRNALGNAVARDLGDALDGGSLATTWTFGPFLAPPPPAVVGDARVYTRVLGTKHVPQSPDWNCGLACWICDRWRETKFVWAPGGATSSSTAAPGADAAASNRLAVQGPPRDDGDVDFKPLQRVKKVKAKEVWTWRRSMFAPCHEGDCGDAFELDWERANLARHCGGEEAAAACKEACREHYSWFRTMFRDYCAQSKALFTLGWNDFTEYVDDCGVMKSGSLRKADNDMVFFGACTTGPKGPLNPKKSLCRFQFLEAAGRIAFARWLKPGEVPDAAAAIAKLAERMSVAGPAVQDKRMCFAEWLEFCEAVDLVDADAGFTERDANVAFLRATKTATDELASDAWRRLDFPRFVEALLRVGDRTVDDDVDETPPESCIDSSAASPTRSLGRGEAAPRGAPRRAAPRARGGAAAGRRPRRQAAEEGEPRRRGRVRPRREEGREALGARARAKREPEGEDAAPKESAAASLLAAMGRRPSKGGGSGAPRSSVPMAS